MSRLRLVSGVLSAIAVAAAGCAGPSGTSTQLTVFAAASLQSSFTQLGRQFEATRPGATVTFNFGGSSDLVAQLQQGAPADLFASADTATMDTARADGLIAGEPIIFATNSMEIAVPDGNPAGVRSFASLADPGIDVVVCAPQVPCGAATRAVVAKTGVSMSPVSEESSVTDVLGKVVSGEAEAGVVYVTDVRAAGEAVEGITIPEADNATTRYPIGVLAGSKTPDVAREFADYVLGPEGQRVLAEAGFGAP
jgi:molybdate transport system substrate-binding protein